jgi:hypothetical protein
MTDDDPVTIRKYGRPQDAHLAKELLESQNIAARIGDDWVTTWMWYIGTALGGTKLVVARHDAARAADVLRTFEAPADVADGTEWFCPRCGAEVDAGFDVCWSCEAVRDEHASGAEGGQIPRLPASEAESSIDEVEQSPADADAIRAWRAAILGLFFAPLQFYVLYLVWKTMRHELSPPATWRFYGALVVSLAMLGSLWILWTVLFRF